MMATLQDLQGLARERSSEKRRELLRAVSDCFLSSDEHSATEVALYDEVVTRVLDEVEPIARAELAERLADIANPPRNALRRLADDHIAVAKSILSRSSALDDDDLERIALNQSQAHLAAIATRAMPAAVHAGTPKKSTNTPCGGVMLVSMRMPTVSFPRIAASSPRRNSRWSIVSLPCIVR